MSNDFYTSPSDIAAVTKALSVDINNIDAAIDLAFDKLPTEAHLKRGTVNYAVDTGVADAYVVALPYVPSGYVDGLEVNFRPIFANTGAATINVNGLGVKSIRRLDSTALLATDINAGAVLSMRYSSATGYFHIAGSSGTGSTGATGPAGPAGPTGPSGALTRVEVSGTASTATSGNDYWLENVAATEVTAPTDADGARFAVTPANGLKTNTIDFGAATVRGPNGTASGVITMDRGARMEFIYSSAISNWVMV